MWIKYEIFLICYFLILVFFFFFLQLLNYLFLLINDAWLFVLCLFHFCFRYVLWEKWFFNWITFIHILLSGNNIFFHFGFKQMDLVLLIFNVLNSTLSGKKSFRHRLPRFLCVKPPNLGFLDATIHLKHIMILIQHNDIFGLLLRLFWSW